jgi:hypothetical protein
MIITDRSKEPFQLIKAVSNTISTSAVGQVAPEGKGIVGTLFSHSDRSNMYSPNWSTSGPWTTFYMGSNSYSDNSLIQWVNMALGDGMANSGSSQNMFGNDSNSTNARTLEWANGERVGNYRENFHYSNATSYPGAAFRMLPIRNTSSGSINITLYGYCSSYGNGNYDGQSMFILTPNTNTYSTVTSVSSSLIASLDSNSTQSSLSGTVSIPPNTTVIICLGSCDFYHTTYRFINCNYFYSLSSTFSNPNIICDMRMLSSLQQSRFNMIYAGAANNTSALAPLWTVTAANYGDR